MFTSTTAGQVSRARWANIPAEERRAYMRAIAKKPRKLRATSPFYIMIMRRVELLSIQVEQMREMLSVNDKASQSGFNPRNHDK